MKRVYQFKIEKTVNCAICGKVYKTQGQGEDCPFCEPVDCKKKKPAKPASKPKNENSKKDKEE